ncbi:MAG: aldo/keto reductase [Rikenellaceae bacterium]
MKQPNPNRYSQMSYAQCGKSSLVMPRISLGLWHNFGEHQDYDRAKEMITHSFDRGITHFDLANNYGDTPGSAEVTFGRILRDALPSYRDELLISTKAGHEMWDGVYGCNSSRKSLVASIDQSLKRTQLDYFDIFYTHRYDGITPIEETAQALTDIVRSGKALYVAISKYPPAEAQQIYTLLRDAKTPAIVAQYRYSLFERSIEQTIIPLTADNGAGVVAFSPLAQGMLSDKYINGVPDGSRAASSSRFLTPDSITPQKRAAIVALNEIAAARNESLAQMALAWAMRDTRVTSLVIGASSTTQIDQNLEALNSHPFTPQELEAIDNITLYL